MPRPVTLVAAQKDPFDHCMRNCAYSKVSHFAWSAGAGCLAAGLSCTLVAWTGPLTIACVGIRCGLAVAAIGVSSGVTKLETDCAQRCRGGIPSILA